MFVTYIGGSPKRLVAHEFEAERGVPIEIPDRIAERLLLKPELWEKSEKPAEPEGEE